MVQTNNSNNILAEHCFLVSEINDSNVIRHEGMNLKYCHKIPALLIKYYNLIWKLTWISLKCMLQVWAFLQRSIIDLVRNERKQNCIQCSN